MKNKVKKAIILFMFFNLLNAASCISLRSELERSLPGKIYKTKKDDALWKLSLKYGIPVEEIAETNGIKSNKILKSKKILFIPDYEESKVCSKKETKISKHLKQRSENQKIKNKNHINLEWPVEKGVILRSFDLRPEQLHEGILIKAQSNTMVHAASDGRVLYAGDDGTSYGKIIIIKHKNPFITVYAHLDKIFTKKDKIVKQLEAIGEAGVADGANSSQLHFQLRADRLPVNPEIYLPTPSN